METYSELTLPLWASNFSKYSIEKSDLISIFLGTSRNFVYKIDKMFVLFIVEKDAKNQK